MRKISWKKVREDFEDEMFNKLKNLPGHREVPENLRDFRNIISHELPETISSQIFKKLISILDKGKVTDKKEARKKYLQPELNREKEILESHKNEFDTLVRSASIWVKKNLPEKKLQSMWKNHETWLPRRYTVYKKQVSFEKIAADTLARFYLINKYVKNSGLNTRL